MLIAAPDCLARLGSGATTGKALADLLEAGVMRSSNGGQHSRWFCRGHFRIKIFRRVKGGVELRCGRVRVLLRA
jgi:hypothetical protein